MPLIISESLRSEVVSANSTQGIVTILLSSADLAKLDLSNLQLFTNDGLDLSKCQAAEPPADACTQNTVAAKLEHGGCNFSDKLASGNQEMLVDSPRPVSSKRNVADEEFSFQTPLILSPAAELTTGGSPFPIFKSKAVADSEKASVSQQSQRMGEISPASQRGKVVCMEFDTPERQIDGECSDGPKTPLNERENVGTEGARRERSGRLRPEVPALVVPRPELEDALRTAEVTLKEVSEETMIDLKASPAAKFLLQVMPWELTPSPLTVANTPASIPFLWEDVPGKPKPLEVPSPLPSLRLPPRLTSAQPPACNFSKPSVNSTQSLAKSNSLKENKGGHCQQRKNTHSWQVLQNLFSGLSRQSSHEEVTVSDSSLQHRDSPHFEGSHTHKEATPNSSESSSFDRSSSADEVTTVVFSDDDGHGANLKNEDQVPATSAATTVHVNSPYQDSKPTGDKYRGNSRKRSIAGSSIKFFANILRRRRDTRFATKEIKCSPEQLEQVSGPSLPSPSNAYRTLRSGKHRRRRKSRTARAFCRLRKKGSRLLVAIYRGVTCALLTRRSDHSEVSDHTQLQYHMLQ